jgi:nucleoside-triphosphatase
MSNTLVGKRVCLLTGAPGTGKTTIIKELVRKAGRSSGGFYTEESRVHGRRVGFRIVTLEGREALFSHVDVKGSFRVGKYGVNIGDLDSVAVAALERATRERDIVVVDEIGKMELLSSSFRRAVEEALVSGKTVVGTIMLARDPWADEIKRRSYVGIIPVTSSNRDEVADRVLDWIRA